MKQYEVVKDLNDLVSILSHKAINRLAKNVAKDIEDKTEIMLLYTGKSERNHKINAKLSYTGPVEDKDRKADDIKEYFRSLKSPKELAEVAKRKNANT